MLKLTRNADDTNIYPNSLRKSLSRTFNVKHKLFYKENSVHIVAETGNWEKLISRFWSVVNEHTLEKLTFITT